MAEHRYVEATDLPSGKRASQIAGMIELLLDAGVDVPVPWEEMCDHVEQSHHGQFMPAFNALELVGAVKRYTYVEDSGTKAKVAFAISDEVEMLVEDE